MQEEVMVLFRELADLPPADRDRYFEEHQIQPDLRAELESLLRYDCDGRTMQDRYDFGKGKRGRVVPAEPEPEGRLESRFG